MSVIAFVFRQYENGSPLSCYKGYFKDTEEALTLLKGDRFDFKYLQLMDLETLGWETYEWIPLYNVVDEKIYKVDEKIYKVDEKISPMSDLVLKHRWDEKQPLVTLPYEEGRGHFRWKDFHYTAGEWQRGEW